MFAQTFRRSIFTCAAATLWATAVCAGEYGEKMPATGEAVSLAQAVRTVNANGEYTGKIRGRITEVCRKKGCFMVLADGEHTARVVFKDYGFFIPKDTPPGMSTVYGELTTELLSTEQAQHFAEDAGRATAGVMARREHQIVASAVVID
ncbi:MAG: DUF4920 domain-containing protein [Pseudomonadota bacterium]